MTNKEAIEELKGLQEFINGTRLKGEIRAEAFDLAIKALEERPQGEWWHYEGMLHCPICKTEFYDDIMEYCGDDVPKFCPNCGARMGATTNEAD